MTGRSGLCDPRQVPAAFDNNFGEGSDDDDQHGQRRQVLPAKHPVDSGPGSRHQFDIVSETRILIQTSKMRPKWWQCLFLRTITGPVRRNKRRRCTRKRR